MVHWASSIAAAAAAVVRRAAIFPWVQQLHTWLPQDHEVHSWFTGLPGEAKKGSETMRWQGPLTVCGAPWFCDCWFWKLSTLWKSKHHVSTRIHKRSYLKKPCWWLSLTNKCRWRQNSKKFKINQERGESPCHFVGKREGEASFSTEGLKQIYATWCTENWEELQNSMMKRIKELENVRRKRSIVLPLFPTDAKQKEAERDHHFFHFSTSNQNGTLQCKMNRATTLTDPHNGRPW